MSVTVRVPAFLGSSSIRHPQAAGFTYQESKRGRTLLLHTDVDDDEEAGPTCATYEPGQWLSASVDPAPSSDAGQLLRLLAWVQENAPGERGPDDDVADVVLRLLEGQPEQAGRVAELEGEVAELREQIGQLAECIVEEFPGEPSQSVGAVELACIMLRNYARSQQPTQATMGAAAEPEAGIILDLAPTDERLLWLLRRAGDEWGPLGVALTASLLSDPQAVARQLIEADAAEGVRAADAQRLVTLLRSNRTSPDDWTTEERRSVTLLHRVGRLGSPPFAEPSSLSGTRSEEDEVVQTVPNDADDPRRDDLEPLRSRYWVRGTEWIVVSRTWRDTDRALTVHLSPASDLADRGLNLGPRRTRPRLV